MAIFSNRKGKVKAALEGVAGRIYPLDRPTPATARLVDLRPPGVFRTGFIPGSYNVPDLACASAARRHSLFRECQFYLLADAIEQLHLFPEAILPLKADTLGPPVVGWFGPDAIQEWQKTSSEIARLDVIDADTLFVKIAAGDTLLLDVRDGGRGSREPGRPGFPDALRFDIEELPMWLEGLPTETALCIAACSSGLASFAASLLWNFGFHRITYLDGCSR